MAPVVVQPIGTGEALEVELSPAASVAELKTTLEAKSGILAAAQRLVVRGRVLGDDECVETATKANGRIFLAVASAALAPAAEARAHHGGSVGSTASASDTTVEVFARTVDSDAEVRVSACMDKEIIELKCEILRHLHHVAPLADVERCSFIFDGHLLESDELLRDVGVDSGARIVVVPPRPDPPTRGRCTWRGALRCARRGAGAARSLPRATWFWLGRTWHDPWSLVRPDAEVRRGQRIHGLGLHPRLVRYGPGQNPRGEDLTLLFSQGIVGGG